MHSFDETHQLFVAQVMEVILNFLKYNIFVCSDPDLIL